MVVVVVALGVRTHPEFTDDYKVECNNQHHDESDHFQVSAGDRGTADETSTVLALYRTQHIEPPFVLPRQRYCEGD